MATIRDIAKHTGLSISTISRYTNNSGYVSDKNCQIIQCAIDELNYVPNKHAQCLFKKLTHTVGLVFPNLLNPFFAQISTILGQMLQDNGFTSILCLTEDDPQKELNALELLSGYRVDGMVIFRAMNKKEISELDFPVISFETYISPATVQVTADNYGGGRLAFQHLYDQGCRQLLSLVGPVTFEASRERNKGFTDLAREKRVVVDVIEISCDYALRQDYYAELHEINFNKYDGVFVFNAMACTLLVSYLSEIGIRIPEDLRVMGFDYTHIMPFMSPRLTTIDQPVEQISQTCFSRLMDEINGVQNDQSKVVLPVALVQGETT